MIFHKTRLPGTVEHSILGMVKFLLLIFHLFNDLIFLSEHILCKLWKGHWIETWSKVTSLKLRSQEIKTRRKTGIIPFCAHLSIHKISWLLKDHCLWSRTVTEPGSFCLTHSKPKCWDTELGSRKDLSARQSSEETKEQASDLPPQKQGDWGIYGIKNKGAGWSEAWGAWGNVVGKTCDNHRSAQV